MASASNRLSIGNADRLLILLGLAMIVLGAVFPGTHSEAISVLIIVGSGLVVMGLLRPRFKEFEIGPGGLKWKLGDAVPQPWVEAEAETLNRVAYRVLGDAERAREIVEETLAKVRRYLTEIPTDKRDVTTFRTLIALLDRADQGQWLSGSRQEAGPANVIEALQGLDFSVRIAYVLRQELPATEVSHLLNRPEAEIARDFDRAREAIGPHIESSARSSNG